jgi:hypothetical protein
MNSGLKLHEGHPAGRDPREMTQDELAEAGHQPKPPLQAIRAHCLDCCGDQKRKCCSAPPLVALPGPSAWAPIPGANLQARRVGKQLGGPWET